MSEALVSDLVREPVAPGGEIRRGIAWNIAGQFGARALNFLFLLILARLLTPRDYGLFGMAAIVISVVTPLSDLGLGAALIQRHDDVQEHARAAFYLNSLVVGFVGLLCFLEAPLVAAIYGEGEIEGIVRILAVGFLARSTFTIHEALLRKRMSFGKLQGINLLSTALYGAAAIALASQGFGAWSLALALLLSNVASGALLAVSSHLPLGGGLGRRKWGDLFGFGRFVFLSGLVWALVLQVDGFVVGKLLGASALGAYALAVNYGRLPLVLLGSAVGDVLFSSFSKLQRDSSAVRDLLLKSVANLSIVSLPLAALTFILADVLVGGLLGPRWAEATGAFRTLGPAFSMLLTAASFAPLYQAMGRPDINLRLGVIVVPLVGSALWLGLPYGTEGVALAMSCAWFLCFLIQIPIVGSLTLTPWWEVIARMRPAAICTALAFLAAVAIEAVGVSPILAASSFLILYLSLLRRLFRESWPRPGEFLARPS